MSEFEKTYEYEEKKRERWAEEFEDGDYYTLSDMMETVNNLKSAHNADMAEKDKRIAELEARLPKVVNVIHHGFCSNCECGRSVYADYNFCPSCSSRLNWTEVEK